MKRILLVLTMFVSILSAYSQATIYGNVTDENNEPIMLGNVAVMIEGELIAGGETDFDGNYNIANINAGTYSIRFSYVGYADIMVEGVVLSNGKQTKLNQKMEAGITLDEIVVIEYKKPLIEVDNTTSGGTVTSDEIKNLPTKSIGGIVATTAGVAQTDDGDDINIKGGRSESTDYYIDGIKVSGNLIPQSEIEQIQVITGGVEAKYGDATSGFVSITTKGPSRKFSGGVELETSQYLDNYGYNLASVYLAGPIIKKQLDDATEISVLGFRLSGQYKTQLDDDPTALGAYIITDEKLADLEANPVSSTGVVRSTLLEEDDVQLLKYNPNENSSLLDFTGKIDARLSDAIDITLSGTYNRSDDRFTPGRRTSTSWNLLNSHNNPTWSTSVYRGNFKFRHKIGGGSSNEVEEGEMKKKSPIQNVTFTLQFGYEKSDRLVQDKQHEDRFFDYGYIGSVQDSAIFVDGLTNQTSQNPDDVPDGCTPSIFPDPQTSQPVYYWHTGWLRAEEDMVPGTVNPVLARYGDGVENGFFSSSLRDVYGMHTNVGQIYNSYGKRETERYSFNANTSFDIVPGGSGSDRHSIELGFSYEQQINRGYDLSPFSLWQIARDQVNRNITGLDYLNDPIEVRENVEVFYNGQPVVLPLLYLYGYNSEDVDGGKFWEAVRKENNIANNEWVNVDALLPEDMDLSYFAPKELTDNINVLDYWGYDYLGNKLSNDATFDDFFKEKENGYKLYNVPANKPILIGGYIQDKFRFKDVFFNIGLRIDRFDANTKVMKDKYSLLEIMDASTFYSSATGQVRPGGIDDDFKVYVTSDDGTSVQGFRDGDTWFDANGTQVNGGNEIFGGGVIYPKFAHPDIDITSDDFDPNSSFTDYVPEFSWAPRLGFSFPIADRASFFAHYDVLVQRPQGSNIVSPLDYLYFYATNRTPSSNANLKPEKTVDYEVGFKQALNDHSALTIQAYYREMRDMIQRTTVAFVPVIGSYETTDNIDFGTVKGFTFTYDLRRTNNILMNASYTLQFADGTGSGSTSASGLTRNGNIRVLYPLSYDERHKFNLVFDYRYSTGKKYNGPHIFGKDIFAGAGINIQGSMVSGRPYTAAKVPGQFSGKGYLGSFNGARKPWTYVANLQVDKDFSIPIGKRPLNINVYFRVQNLFDTRNIVGVYTATGSPDDDGFLQSPLGQQTLQDFAEVQDYYRRSYAWKMLNPNNYTLPRRMYLGLRLGL